MSELPFTILGIDPGKTTGAVLIQPNEDGKRYEVLIADNIRQVDFHKWVNSWNQVDSPWQIGVVACENFILRPKSKQGKYDRIPWEQMWLKLETSELIGSVKFRCHQLKLPLAMQEPSIKPTGYGHAGLEYKKGQHTLHTHLTDATAHAVYLMRTGLRRK